MEGSVGRALHGDCSPMERQKFGSDLERRHCSWGLSGRQPAKSGLPYGVWRLPRRPHHSFRPELLPTLGGFGWCREQG